MIVRSCLVLLAASVAATACHSRDERSPATTFAFDSAWVRATPDTGVTTAAYVSITNGLQTPIKISGFSSDAARTVELHESMSDSHMMMHMTPKPDTTIGAGEQLVMRPSGLHLMLIGTTRALRAGDRVRVAMHLSDGSIVSTTAHVRAP